MATTIRTVESAVANSTDGQQEEFAEDIMKGLSARRKSIPAKYHYDAEGSRLFERITELPEYYLTSCEMNALQRNRDCLADLVQGDSINLVEFGPGDGRKTMPLVEHLIERAIDIRYIAVDISPSALEGLAGDFRERLPDCPVDCLAADYLEGIRWLSRDSSRRNLVLFLGSSIGNFSPGQAESFLQSLNDSLKDRDLLVTGFDRVKEPELIHRAYNDSEDVTAEFNLNLLMRINRELDGEFDISRFTFEGRYDERDRVMRSHLLSNQEQRVRVGALDRTFSFEQGEPIHTEDSHKYRESDIEAMAARTGFRVRSHLYDSRQYFIDSVWEATGK